MMNRRQALQAFAAVATYSAMRRSGAQTVNPLSLPLATSSTPLFTYIGHFNGPSDQSFQYGGGGLGVSNSSPGVLGQLCATGIQQGNNCVGIMNIPAPTGSGGAQYTGGETATTVVPGTTAIPTGSLGNPYNESISVAGLLYGGKSYVTAAVNYDATGTQNAWLLVGNTNLTGFGAPCGARGSAGTSYSRMFSQGLAIVPSLWQPLLGGPLAIVGGIGGLSVISNQDCGFHFSTFNPANVVSGQSVPITQWLTYPYFNNTSNDQQVSKLWGLYPSSQANWGGQVGDNLVCPYAQPVGTGFIVPGTRTLLFVQAAAYGPPGAPHSSPCDGGASGSNDTPIAPDTQPYRRIQLVAYDLASVISLRNSGSAIDAAKPYAWWPFPNATSIFGGGCYTASGFGYKSWASYDIYNQRLYVSMGWPGMNGRVHVFNVAAVGGSSGTSSPTLTPNPPTNVQVT
jgi:hypothetical protein